MSIRKVKVLMLLALFALSCCLACAEGENDDMYFRGLFIPYVHQFNQLTANEFEDVLKWNRYDYETGEDVDGALCISVPTNIGQLQCWFSRTSEADDAKQLSHMIYTCDKYSIHVSGNAAGHGATINLKYARRVMAFNADMDVVISFYNDYCHGSIK